MTRLSIIIALFSVGCVTTSNGVRIAERGLGMVDVAASIEAAEYIESVELIREQCSSATVPADCRASWGASDADVNEVIHRAYDLRSSYRRTSRGLHEMRESVDEIDHLIQSAIESADLIRRQ